MVDKIFILKAKGIARALSFPHQYNIPSIGAVIIKTKRIKESTNRVEGEDAASINIEETKDTTQYTVEKITDHTVVYEGTMEGIAGDDQCLALMGYYLTSWDEEQEALKIRRLLEIAKFIKL
jgi:hypothetical protein